MPEWSRDIAVSVISALIGAALVWIIGRITPDPFIRALGGHTQQEFGELQTQLSQKETQVAAITTQFNSAKAQLDNTQTQLGSTKTQLAEAEKKLATSAATATSAPTSFNERCTHPERVRGGEPIDDRFCKFAPPQVLFRRHYADIERMDNENTAALFCERAGFKVATEFTANPGRGHANMVVLKDTGDDSSRADLPLRDAFETITCQD
jgi:hypothetical protein